MFQSRIAVLTRVALGPLLLTIMACAAADPPQMPDPSDATVIDQEPLVGAPPPGELTFSHATVIGSSQMDRATYVRYRGVVFELAVNLQGLVSYVGTDD